VEKLEMTMRFILGWFLVFIVALLIDYAIVEPMLGEAHSVIVALLVSATIASAAIYYWLVRETRCPYCRIPLPFQRQEEKRRLMYTEQRTMTSENWWLRRERGNLLLYGIYEVYYRCRRHEHKWKVREARMIKEYPPVDHKIPPDVEPPDAPF
jgi:hypothetical protein